MKKFIITIDTESDNQWNIQQKQTTENAKYIPRFQSLSEKYGFKPVYLIDYSMANDASLVRYLKGKSLQGLCEIGMHLHAWDTPPRHEIDGSTKERPYLIEYPKNIMDAKIKSMTDLITSRFEQSIVSHRAGRWAVNNDYIHLLHKNGYKIDCSITPGVNWQKQMGASLPGPDYSTEKCSIYRYDCEPEMLEIPMTIRKMHCGSLRKNDGMVPFVKDIIKNIIGRNIWLRPALFSYEDMIKLIQVVENEKEEYMEFMMHSSELMPGGSPYYTTEEAIEKMYKELTLLFDYVSMKGYSGVTLAEMYNMYSNNEG